MYAVDTAEALLTTLQAKIRDSAGCPCGNLIWGSLGSSLCSTIVEYRTTSLARLKYSRPSSFCSIYIKADSGSLCCVFVGVGKFGVRQFGVCNNLAYNNPACNNLVCDKFGMLQFGVLQFGVQQFGVRQFGVLHFSVQHFGVLQLSVRQFGVPTGFSDCLP
jgi:hypothetical protein